MRTPVFVGLIELEQQPWVDVGALVLAHQLSVPGHRVVVIDGDPCSAYLSSWARTLPDQGAALLPLLSRWMSPSDVTPATDAVAELLQDDAIGPIGVMRAADGDRERRPVAPSARSVMNARESLDKLQVNGEPADVVIVRLPPLSSPLGVALAANLCDVLVPILSPTPGELNRSMKALNQVGALRGEGLVLFPVEMSDEEPWDASINQALWLHALRAMPMSRVRPWPKGQPRLERVFQVSAALRDDFRDVADALLLQLDLAHPDAVEHVMRADALQDGQGAYHGFARMLELDAPEALRFYGEVLAKRSATRKSTVEALRAMVDSPRCDADDIAWGFKYAIQKFRPAEPDKLSEFMYSLGLRLLEALRMGNIEEGENRLRIDVADAVLKCADYRASIKQSVEGMDLQAEHMLLAAARKLGEPQEALRLALVLSDHAERVKHSRNAELAMDLVRLGLGADREPVVLLRAACDVLAPFLPAQDNPHVLLQHREYAMALLPLDPGVAHYNLIYSWTYALDKERALDHFIHLGEVNIELLRLAAKDQTLRDFFLGIGTPDFFNAVPKKDES